MSRGKRISLFLNMLVGYVPNSNPDISFAPVFLPDGKSLLVGQALFQLLADKSEREPVVAEVGSNIDDIPASPDGGHVLLKLASFDFANVKVICQNHAGTVLYVLCDTLPPYGFQPVFDKEPELRREGDSFDDFAEDFTKVKSDYRKAPKLIDSPDEGKENGAGAGESDSGVPINRTFWGEVRRNGLNPLFSITFIFLGLATEFGYFFLGEDSSQAFRVACIIMATLFPFMSCLPVGFLMEDKKCKKPTDSFFFMATLTLIVLTAFICPIICLSVGNYLRWKSADLSLFTLLTLSAVAWIALRLLIDPFIRKISKKRA